MTTSMRVFIAVEIDDQAKQKISELITCLKKSGADVKWITENQMHLTLKFLGNIGKDKIPVISDALAIISDNFKPFRVTFSRIGAFPRLDKPAVIWLGIDKGAEYLKILNDSIENTLEKLGIKKETREFKPHLTLARVRSDKNMASLIKLIREKETDIISENDTLIDKLSFLQSTLNPAGAVYTVISEKCFGASAA